MNRVEIVEGPHNIFYGTREIIDREWPLRFGMGGCLRLLMWALTFEQGGTPVRCVRVQ